MGYVVLLKIRDQLKDKKNTHFIHYIIKQNTLY